MSSVCKFLFVIGITFLAGSYCAAQSRSSNFEVGVNAGTLIYQGDLTPGAFGSLNTITPALGLYAAKSLNSYFSLRANFTVGKLSEDDALYSSPEWKQHRNFKFSTPLVELSGLLVFSPYGQSVDNNRKLTPYVFAGAGASFLAISRNWSNVDTIIYDSKSTLMSGLALDIAHRTPHVVAVLPVGAGIRYTLNPQIDLSAEATYRLTSSDYLDGFKYAANPEKKDSYYGVSLGVIFKFSNYKCPPVKR
jgi:hypothetical protein